MLLVVLLFSYSVLMFLFMQSIAKNSKKLPRASQPCGGGSLPNVNKIISDTDSSSSVSFLKVNTELIIVGLVMIEEVNRKNFLVASVIIIRCSS